MKQQHTVERHPPALGGRCRAVLLGCFVVTRLAAYGAGVRFDAAGIESEWQVLDVDLLRHDLFTSLWNLHDQPPLFNAFVGLVLHLPSRLQQPAFALTYLALGVVLMLSMASLMTELGVGRRTATALTAVFIAGPAALLYENWLFYTYPTAAILAFASLALLRWTRTGRRSWAIGFFSSIAVLALTRATWHLGWLAVIVGLVLYTQRARWRQALGPALIPVLLVTGLYVKNAVMFGTPAASSWQGSNLAYITLLQLPDDERHRMIDDGELSNFALVPPFSRLARYDAFLSPRAPTGVAALDQRLKRNGEANLNNIQYVEIDRKYLADALVIARAHPEVVLRGIAYSGRDLFVTSADYFALHENQHELGWWYPTYITVVEGRMGTQVPEGHWGELLGHVPKSLFLPESRPGLTIMLVYLVAAIGAVYSLIGLLRRRVRATPVQLTVCFMSLTILWSIGASLLVGSGESNRFRFEIDPLAIALAAWTVHRWLSRRRGDVLVRSARSRRAGATVSRSPSSPSLEPEPSAAGAARARG